MRVSPDGAWLASIERLADNPQFGLLLYNLDSLESRLLLKVDDYPLSDPVWSPDGKWLLFTVHRYDQSPDEEFPVLLDLQSCQLYPLGFRGTVQDWSR